MLQHNPAAAFHAAKPGQKDIKMVLELAESSHPLMTTELQDFDFANPPCDPIGLVNSMIEVMKQHRGLGVSANQLGLPYRVFVLWSENPIVCFNPRIIDSTSELVSLEEGCLSYPHLLVKIKRPTAIKVRFQNERGEVVNEKFIGMTARAFQHELDHLNGIVYTKRANPVHLARALNQQKNLTRQLKRGQVRVVPKEVSEQVLSQINNIPTGEVTFNTSATTLNLGG